jgi:hypothetical protein
MLVSFKTARALLASVTEENDGSPSLHPGGVFYFARTSFGSTRHELQTTPLPTRPRPGRASIANAWTDPTEASRAAASGAAKLVPRTRA